MIYRISFLMLIAMLLGSCINDEEPEAVSLKEGDVCPDFSVTLSDGRRWISADMTKPTFIVFFNTGCGDCRKEFPVVEDLYSGLQADGAEADVIAISREEGEESVRAYWEKEKLTIPYSAQEGREIYSLFATSVIPRIYLVDCDRRIRRVWTDDPLPDLGELEGALSSLR